MPTGYGAIRYVNGQHVIYQAQLQVVVKSLTTTYGQAPTFDVRYYGLRNGDSVPARVLPPSVVPAGAVDGIQADSATDAGTYTIWPQVYDQNYEDHVTTGTWTEQDRSSSGSTARRWSGATRSRRSARRPSAW